MCTKLLRKVWQEVRRYHENRPAIALEGIILQQKKKTPGGIIPPGVFLQSNQGTSPISFLRLALQRLTSGAAPDELCSPSAATGLTVSSLIIDGLLEQEIYSISVSKNTGTAIQVKRS